MTRLLALLLLSPLPAPVFPAAPPAAPPGVRLAVLKAENAFPAVLDAGLAVQAGRGAGPHVRTVGSGTVVRRGPAAYGAWLDRMCRREARPGDTLIVHTIGHGMPDGTLVGVGTRKEFLEAVAAAAARNKQRIVWWQLSCFACAQLPDVKTLPPEARKLLTVVNSSPATEPSWNYRQARLMRSLFAGLADGSPDADADGTVTAAELSAWLDAAEPGLRRGSLVRADSKGQAVFRVGGR